MKALVFHYKIGTDGVSLEIGKRKKVLSRLGVNVKVVAGEGNADIKIPGMGISGKRITGFREKMFSSGIQEKEFEKRVSALRKRFESLLKRERPDIAIVHNLFSLAYNIPASFALMEAIENLDVPTEAIHHDFWWDRAVFNTPSDFVRDLLFELPPSIQQIKSHVVINSIDAEKLWKRRRIRAKVFGDLFDFEKTYNYRREEIKSMLGIGREIVLLQATRPVARKAIELSVDVASHIPDSVLVLTNKPEGYVDSGYLSRVEEYARGKGVEIIKAFEDRNARKVPFFEFYKIAHFAMFPSIKEGFGNQFLEAVFYKVLPIVFEYPVFSKDIKPEGYEYISLGGKFKRRDWRVDIGNMAKKAAKEAMKYHNSREMYKKAVERNWKIAMERHSPRVLENYYRALLSRIMIEKSMEKFGSVASLPISIWRIIKRIYS